LVNDRAHVRHLEDRVLTPKLLFIGGEDHHLRVPFLLALRDRGFDVQAAGTGPSADFDRNKLDYVRFQFNRFINPLADLTAVRALTKLIAEAAPDLVHSFDTKPNLLVPFAVRNLRHISAVRTINGLGWVYSSRSPLAMTVRPIYCGLHRLANRSVSATVFQNRQDQEFFSRRRMVSAGTHRLIPGSGIDVVKFDADRASGPSRAALRKELGLEGREVVVTVTRLTRQKGIPALMEAAALVHKSRPNVRFVLVGPRESEGPLAVSQAEIDLHAPYVMAIGARRDVPSILGMADVFAFPTEYREGVPRALMEAGLAGLPIVATEMPGCSDVVQDGVNGYMVPPRNPEMLAARVIDLLENRELAKVMGARTIDLIRGEFSLDQILDHYTALYSELLSHCASAEPPLIHQSQRASQVLVQ
jgi:glycosyltransferase involved in cell wall biosynthesis